MFLSNLLKNILLVIAGIALGFVMSEGILRMFFSENIVLFPRFHESVSYGDYILRRHMPNQKFTHQSIEGRWDFTINNKGFRNYQNSDYWKSEDMIRILSVGDSQTLGFEVSQDSTFSSRLENMFRDSGHKCEVLNTGVSGFSTAEEFVFLKEEGLKYKPDFVVIGFFNNDYQDNLRTKLFGLRNDSLINISWEYAPGTEIQQLLYSFSLFKWLSSNSYSYSFIFNNVWNYFKSKSISNAHNENLEYAVSIDTSIEEYGIKLTEKLLEKIYDVCLIYKAKLIIVDIPAINSEGQAVASLDLIQKNHPRKFCDILVSFDQLVSEIHSTEIHRRYGHRHISEKTHEAIARNIFEAIQLNFPKQQNPRGE